MQRGLSIVAVLSLAICATECLAQQAPRSSVEDVLPRDFDAAGEYRTMSVPELHDYIYPTIGITNSFVGQRVKVFGHYVAPRQPWKPKSLPERIWLGKGRDVPDKTLLASVCLSAFCQGLDGWYTVPIHDVSWERIKQNISKRGYYAGFLIADPRAREAFNALAKDSCTDSHACHLLLSGTLRYAQIEVRSGDEFKKAPLAYLEVDAVRLYNGSISPNVEAAQTMYELYRLAKPLLPSTGTR
jgi:hypothetical protein